MRYDVTLVVVLLLLAPPVLAEDGADGPQPDRDPVEAVLLAPQATGLLVTEVEEKSQAAEVGLAPGDVFVAYDGKPVASHEALRDAIFEAQEKQSVELEVVRIDGTRQRFTLAAGHIGVQILAIPVRKGEAVAPLPPCTGVQFDWARLDGQGHEDWYALDILGVDGIQGFERVRVWREDGDLLSRREIAFDGGERWGVQHFDVKTIARIAPIPRLDSWSFENLPAGFHGEGRVADGTVRFAWCTDAGAAGEEGRVLAEDLPLVPTYMVESLARLMPREKDACFQYRPIFDGSGKVGRPSALVGVGRDPVQIDETTYDAFKYEVRVLGGDSVVAFWVDAEGHVVKADYGGARTTKRPRDEVMRSMPRKVIPRTVD